MVQKMVGFGVYDVQYQSDEEKRRDGNTELKEKWFLYQESLTLFFNIVDKFTLRKSLSPIPWIVMYFKTNRGIFFYRRHVMICEKAKHRMIRRKADYYMLNKLLK